ncbi:peptidoglycan DD-metalloendopeptidase family protein [Effusibacillus dendaii]|uniref:Uncharacterized protein n=1 Tax=Effusibacillus dendaii TaxID=2743772 RepID=A0A7I8DCM9_9BACL|nr:peptidoglycan DD-metalloendopeptidase family protein [Effusibacillus dendaii]BCJ87928.1 hypothetical protein skT53_29130 [Effusibacillus dendaii]
MADLNPEWHTHLRTFAVANKDYTKEQLRQLHWKKLLQDVKGQIHHTFTVGKTAAAAAIVLVTALGAFGIQHAVNKTTLYYKVYVDGQYVGDVKDPNFVYEKIALLGDKFHASVSVVPAHERLRGSTSEAAVSLALNDALYAKRNAVVIRVNGDDAVAVQDEAAAQAVIDQLKAKFASADTAVQEVKISQSIAFVKERVNRDEVRSIDEAVAALLQSKEKPKKYLVSRGDSLWTIANRNHISVETLKQVNPQITDENALQEGEEIAVNSSEPIVTVETVEELNRTVPLKFETVYQDDATMNKGEQQVLVEGHDGESQQRVQIRKKNGVTYAEVVLSEQVLQPKTDQVIRRGVKIPGVASGDWVWPVASRTISSTYGEWRGNSRHNAIDISAAMGTPVYASNNGRVIFAGWDNGGYGKCIRIDHGNGIVSIYGHLSVVGVSVGQTVGKGDLIGRVGSTGESTGPHLHYEVRVNGVQVNPTPYM